jgi:hypothetical protein
MHEKPRRKVQSVGKSVTTRVVLVAGQARAHAGGRAGRAPQGRGDAGERMDWLQRLSHTQRSYRKEAERFLL